MDCQILKELTDDLSNLGKGLLHSKLMNQTGTGW